MLSISDYAIQTRNRLANLEALQAAMDPLSMEISVRDDDVIIVFDKVCNEWLSVSVRLALGWSIFELDVNDECHHDLSADEVIDLCKAQRIRHRLKRAA